MKARFRFYMFMAAAIAGIGFTSCSKDDDETGGVSGGLKGYYIRFNYVAKESDFDEINEAIENHELLASYRYGGETHKYYATYDLFIDSDGCFYNEGSNSRWGRFKNTIDAIINVIQIVDNNTLAFCSGDLYVDNGKYDDVLYKFYAGPVFGKMVYRSESPIYYTYTRVENKIIVSNGDIYTIMEDGSLIEDGGSTKWSKYDPKKEY